MNCAWAEETTAQVNYTVQHFTNENGLNQNSINGLALDTNGFLWISTQGGLSRDDGSIFKLYNSSNGSLSVDRMAAVIVSKNGTVYAKVASRDQAVYRVAKNYRLQYDSTLNGQQPVYFEPQIGPVTSGKLFAGAGKDAFGKLIAERMRLLAEPRNRIFINEHTCYLVYQHRIELIDFARRNVRPCAEQPGHLRMALIGHTLLAFDSLLNCKAIRDGELLKKLPGTNAFNVYIRSLKGKPASALAIFRNNNTEELLFNTGNEVWHITQKNGTADACLIFSNAGFSKSVGAMLYDKRSETLFIGTFISGLYILRKSPFYARQFDSVDITRNVIYAQQSIGNGLVANRFFKYDPYSARQEPLAEDLPPTAFFQSADYNIWYSTVNAIVRCDSMMKIYETIPFPKNIDDDNIAGCFLEDAAHKIWFSSNNSLGYVKDHKNHLCDRSFDYFRDNKISVIFNFNDRIIWIGHENGILAYNVSRNKIDQALMLPGTNVRCIYRAKDGSIWIGTYGRGFYKYVDGRFLKMPLDESGYLLFAHSFTEDHHGFFWIPTNNGLFQCKKAALDAYAKQPDPAPVYYYYYKNTGKYTNEFNGGSNPPALFYKDRLLLLPTINGVVSLAPDSIRVNLPGTKILGRVDTNVL